MKHYVRRVEQSLRRIQNAPEDTKRRILITASSLSAIIVIFLWIVYINVTIPGSPQTLVKQNPTSTEVLKTQEKPSPSSGKSFFETLGRGAYIVFQDIQGKVTQVWNLGKTYFDTLSRALEPKNQIFIEATSTEYIPPVTDPLPKQILP